MRAAVLSDPAPARAGLPDAEALAAANINPATLLATDYLNVFNEALMLIQMAPDAPDMLDELADWAPVGYEAHFARSGFIQKDLVIAAYRAADRSVREPFDASVAELSGIVRSGIDDLLASADDAGTLQDAAPMWSAAIEAGVAHLDALIHGRADGGCAQDDIDALFAD
jgi:hypothetical protein